MTNRCWPLDADILLVRAVRSAGYGRRRQPRWCAVKKVFACGSGYAQQICIAAGFDPDEVVGYCDDGPEAGCDE